MKPLLFNVLFILCFFCPVASAAQIIGEANIHDADTFTINGIRVRLHGVDAAELDQICGDTNGQNYWCGMASTEALAEWVSGDTLVCQPTGQYSYKRPVVDCSVRDVDIADWLVLNGYALVDSRFSKERTDLEAEAKANKSGLWQGRFIPPWEWRKQKKRKFIGFD